MIFCPGPICLCPAQNDQNGVRATTARSGNLMVWVFCGIARAGELTTSVAATLAASSFPDVTAGTKDGATATAAASTDGTQWWRNAKHDDMAMSHGDVMIF